MKISTKINVFESRNDYELLVSIMFSVFIFKRQGVNCLIYSTNSLSAEIKSQINSLDGVEVRCVTHSQMKRMRVFVSLFIFYMMNFFRVERFYIFHEVSPVVFFKFFRSKISLVEHGEINYLDISNVKFYKGSIYAFLKKKVMRDSFVGESTFFDEIYLKNIEKAPSKLKHKVHFLDLKSMFKLMAKSEVKLLNSIFLFDERCKKDCFKESVLLITQPFSELGIISEEAKLHIYQSALANELDKLVIKPHPKELTDYKTIFPDAVVLNSTTPFELFYINDVEFKTVITINSSAILSVNCVNTVVLGSGVLGGHSSE